VKFEAGREVQRVCPKSDKLSNDNVRNKATVEASMLCVAPLALQIKFQSITGARASKQVSEADVKDFSSGPEDCGLEFARRTADRRSSE
jgi:hypothetical protein